MFWTVSNVIQMIQQVIINKTKFAAAAQKSNVVDVKAKVHGGKKRK